MDLPSRTAKDILGQPGFTAISYGGYRSTSRDVQPTIKQIKEDLLILSAMGIRIVRTYNVQLAQAGNVLVAIKELKAEDASFEMYVMLGAWIDCKNAWTGLEPDHNQESEQNQAEIKRATDFAKQYPDIVKVIAVGNEAMVKWAAAYYVQPGVILKWVDHLQDLKTKGDLLADLWITSSDNFASWGGGGEEYHVEDLNKLFRAVDYVSIHTYPMHDTHYNPVFWGVTPEETEMTKEQQIDAAMVRSRDYAIAQYDSVVNYMHGIGVDKPIHIGETGWASSANELYGNGGSNATDEYKQALYHDYIREWAGKNEMACFYFEAFDEPWKDAGNPGGSENFFGLFTVGGKAKYALWSAVDAGIFEGLTRDGNPIAKTYGGDLEKLLADVPVPNELVTPAH
ncbi:glycoside hydrolase family 17 protein [Neolewinella antarctica]|uniref:Endo-1,3-beta-glucanase btgC n=1 Tax=Neolewinella antarctica TaxID=442734 RepID=A0ABX0XAJ8_9BACT|nr:glycosyl hydrolase family 17 [Neolewinella antarctica]NJC26260.1 exo-beta-1,3-glucanase (GH17 family) [Neolewinella antarctica]